MINFQEFKVLTFDCYGTLIDWESGILKALKTILSNHNVNINNQEILELFAQRESIQEAGEYLKYREVLKKVVQDFGEKLKFTPTEHELNQLAESIQSWEPFLDTVEALKILKKRYKLAVISNVDDGLFADTARKLEVEFDWIITAEQVKSYKPALQNFEVAIQCIGISPSQILHVAQSVYHDIVPAKSLGIAAVWVNRRKEKEGFGATLSASGTPDLEVPDLKTLVTLMGVD
jgi:2-haloacid dehalogenase